MSMPSTMYFIKDGETLGTSSCDVGWFLSGHGFERCIREGAMDNPELWKNCTDVMLYGYSISKTFILSHKTRQDCASAISAFLNLGR